MIANLKIREKCVSVSYSFMKNRNVVGLTVPKKKFYCNKQEENLKRITGHMNVLNHVLAYCSSRPVASEMRCSKSLAGVE